MLKQIRDVGVCSLTVLPISGDLLLWLAQIGSGIAIYLLFCLLFRPPAFVEMWELIRRKSVDRGAIGGGVGRNIPAWKPKTP